MSLKIHPSVGIPRLGNSPDQFFLAPDTIGGLPYECDRIGNKSNRHVVNFKDANGLIKRQGQVFKIYDGEEEITLDHPKVKSIEWMVHLANKKAAWYAFNELDGNLLFPNNSYAENGTPFNNPSVPLHERQKLIVDMGWRKISGAQNSVRFVKENVPHGYPASFPPDTVTYGLPVKTLGELKTDDCGRLIVLGGHGHSGGNEEISGFGGANSWHDDISDGPVYCTVTYKDGTEAKIQAWVVVGSPDFAPEITNISSLDDTMFDVGVRHFNLVPEMWNQHAGKVGDYNKDFIANYQRDILPIIKRMAAYQWVANVQNMTALTSTIFDFTDNSEANKKNRMNYLSYFRKPNGIHNNSNDQPSQILFRSQVDASNPYAAPTDFNFPMLPANSGTNSVSNKSLVKFLALNTTQYFLLEQWAEGKFVSNPNFAPYHVNKLDAASVGNCVGLPMCPGIEVTWSMQNPKVYADSYIIHDQKGPYGFDATGLDWYRDECEGGGCQPGDLTKRMAVPWQADFFQCTIQGVNFTNPAANQVPIANPTQPALPAYYTYWWPPQAPWDTLAGDTTEEEQNAANTQFGQQMNYARGINQFAQMIEFWYALAFIRDRNAGNDGYPFFTETERLNELFVSDNIPMSTFSKYPNDSETTIPVWYVNPKHWNAATDEAQTVLKVQTESMNHKTKKLAETLETIAFKRVKIADGGMPMPRSGTRSRR